MIRPLARALATLALASAFSIAHATPQTLPVGATIEVAFTPGDALPLVLRTILAAKQSVVVAAYSFTSKPIALALVDLHKRGVKVAVVVDAGEATKQYSAARFLANHGVPVRINDRYSIMHQKILVVDQRDVQTGSFNYTAAAAERNAENVIVVANAPSLAGQYVAEWSRLWSEGKDLPANY